MNENVAPVPMLDVGAQNGPLLIEFREAFEQVMSHGQFILGPEVQALEEQLAGRLGVNHAIGVSSGTDALLVSLMALGIGPGDEVITTPLSFLATLGSILRLGAKPVFVDIGPDSFLLDPEGVEAAITGRTRAIIPVHLFGRSVDMGRLCAVAEAHGLPVVEDAAQALGASWNGRKVGGFGAFGCFSFFPSKNLGGCGDGGLVTCQDPVLADRVRALRGHGARTKYVCTEIGGNFRLDTLQAALLLVKLPHLETWTQARTANARHYERLLGAAGLSRGRLRLPELVPGHVVNQYVVRTDRRDALRTALSQANIASEIYYPLPLHRQPCLAPASGTEANELVHVERACSESLALPVFPELTPTQIERVAEVALQVLR